MRRDTAMKHKIYTRNDQKKEPLTPAARALVKRAITAALDYEQFEGAAEVSVLLEPNGRHCNQNSNSSKLILNNCAQISSNCKRNYLPFAKVNLLLAR